VKYFVTVGGKDLVVEVDGERVVVNGREAGAHLSPVPGTPLRHLLLDAESIPLVLEPAGAGAWRLTLEGVRYDLRVVDERTRHIAGLAGATAARAGPAVLRAPMPGLVVRVMVSAGQKVEAGRGVVVLEAMKMENELRATAPGVVDRVIVTAGQAVEKGQPLVEFLP
jgi:pyruvate carboxylase subunit B